MKPLWVTFIAGFIILFSFQNCQKPPHLDEINSLSSNGQLINHGSKVVLADHQIKDLQLFSKVQEKIIKNGNTFSMLSNRKYVFTFASSSLDNEVIVSSDSSELTETRCLTEGLKNELQSLLAASSVCEKPDAAHDTEKICAAVITPAYANLETESEVYSLGSATDSCGSNSVDLCGSESESLKGYIKNLDNQIQNLKCN